MNKRTITVDEVREHDARTNRGWGRWRRTGDDGSEDCVLLRRSGDCVETFAGQGRVDKCSVEYLTARWTPLDFASMEPIAGHEDVWRAAVCNCGTGVRARWNGAIVVVSYRGPIGEWGPEHQYSACDIAREERLYADKIARAAGASETFRGEVFRNLINDASQARGLKCVVTCGHGVGERRWDAVVHAFDWAEFVGRSHGATEVAALERLAVFLGVSR